MKIETIETLDGEEVELVNPETDEEREELERQAEDGELDDGLSFGDR